MSVLLRSRFHFIGIGGIGMSGLAELLFNMGAQITGSDVAVNDQTQHLTKLGIKIFKSHNEKNVGDVDVVVYSSAVQNNNLEIKAARKKKIPIIPRAEVLAEIMRLKRGIAVAGTHGKTTTTSMIASIFIHAGLDPTVVVGGRLDLIKSTSKLGQGQWLIGEADESDGSFLKLNPEIAIITNIDDDHLDFYKKFSRVQKAFLDFAKLIPFYGVCIVCGDNFNTKKVFLNYDKRIIFYGFNEDNDYYLQKNIIKNETRYTIIHNKKKIGEFKLRVHGEHNALNALAAILVSEQAGVDFLKCIDGVEKYQGVDRRMQYLGEKDGIYFYDDYGHHPTEIKAVLKAFKEVYPKNRLVVLFQPHRYTRTRDNWQDFKSAFVNCDQLFLLDIYSAREKPIKGITAQKLLKAIKIKNKKYIPKNDFNPTQFFKNLKSGDIFLTLGAGDIQKVPVSFLTPPSSK